MAAPLLLRTIPLFRHRLQPLRLAVAVSLLTRRPCSTLTRPDEYFSPALHNDSLSRVKDESLSHSTRIDDPDYRKWKDKEQEILNDVKPITLFAKDLIHSSRYMDGERLTEEDEKTVLEKLLAYHPHSEDKLGCGLNFIMENYKLSFNLLDDGNEYVVSLVPDTILHKRLIKISSVCRPNQKLFWRAHPSEEVDRHPQFRQSRCLFIVRTDGGWIDFSYQKCLRSYIRHKYPSYAEKFIKEHYKRSS